ncbi:MAG: hypothetical protein RL692_149, partial [Planctomycetota bacterium]
PAFCPVFCFVFPSDAEEFTRQHQKHITLFPFTDLVPTDNLYGRIAWKKDQQIQNLF